MLALARGPNPHCGRATSHRTTSDGHCKVSDRAAHGEEQALCGASGRRQGGGPVTVAQDNYIDELTDCDDPDGFGLTGCEREQNCTNGQDNIEYEKSLKQGTVVPTYTISCYRELLELFDFVPASHL